MIGKKTVAILFGVCLLSLSFISVNNATAAILWIERFSDGNYDGWMIEEGTFDASSYYLEATSAGWNNIYNTSPVSCGYWGYDLYEDYITEIDIHVFIIAIGYQTDNISGYSVSLEYGTISNLTLYRWDDGVYHILDRDTVPDAQDWVNYNITRDDMGFFQVVRISEVVLFATDTTYETCQFFLFYSENGGSIDNITIMECGYEFTTPTPTPTPTPTDGPIPPIWYVIGGVVVTGVVILIWLWWRKR